MALFWSSQIQPLKGFSLTRVYVIFSFYFVFSFWLFIPQSLFLLIIYQLSRFFSLCFFVTSKYTFLSTFYLYFFNISYIFLFLFNNSVYNSSVFLFSSISSCEGENKMRLTFVADFEKKKDSENLAAKDIWKNIWEIINKHSVLRGITCYNKYYYKLILLHICVFVLFTV